MPKANRKRTASLKDVSSSDDEQPGNTLDAVNAVLTPSNSTESKPKAKKCRPGPSQKQNQQPTLSQAAIDAINTVAENSNDTNDSMTTGDDDVTALRMQVSEMSNTINTQTREIDLLKKTTQCCHVIHGH